MSEQEVLSPRQAMERERKRLLEQADEINRDMAEFDRLVAKYPALRSATANAFALTRSPTRSLANLVEHYRRDERSPYCSVRFRTRQNYDGLLRIIEADLGSRNIVDIGSADLSNVYQAWTKRGDYMAHALVTMLRALCKYGSNELRDRECERLSGCLHSMRVRVSKSENNRRLSLEDVTAIIRIAHEMKLPSMALAQALQFEGGLAQRDVIGEWVPESEDGESKIHDDGFKWLRGIRWDEIDETLVLRHETSKRGKLIELPLSEYPLVMTEFARIERGYKGAVITHEDTGFPYKAHIFRELWREIARRADIPDEIKNMDSANASNERDGERIDG